MGENLSAIIEKVEASTPAPTLKLDLDYSLCFGCATKGKCRRLAEITSALSFCVYVCHSSPAEGAFHIDPM